MTSDAIAADIKKMSEAVRSQTEVNMSDTSPLWLAEIAYQLAVKNEQEAARFNFWIGLMEKIADKINAEKEKAAL